MTRRRELIELAQEMRARGLTVATCGNLSARSRKGMLITPTRSDASIMRRRDLVDLTLDGVGRRGTPSLEWRLHAAIYRARPDVGAIAHTHSPRAMARSFDPDGIEVHTEEAGYLGMALIPVSPWRPPGSEALAAAVTQALGERPAVLLARHGVFGVGATPRAALEHCATVELLAHVHHLRAQSQRLATGDPPLAPGCR